MVTGLTGNDTLRPGPKIELVPESWRRDWLRIEAGAVPGRYVVTGLELGTRGGGGVVRWLDIMKESQEVRL